MQGKYGVLLPFASDERAPSLDAAIEDLGRVAVYPLHHVELWTECNEDQRTIERTKQVLGEYGLHCTIHAPFVDFTLASADESVAQACARRLQQTISLAEQLNAQSIAIHPGNIAAYESREEVMRRLVNRLEAIRQESGTTIPLAVENLRPKYRGVQRTLVDSEAALADLVELYPSAKLTLDVGHALQAGMDILTVARIYRSHLGAVHLHDIDPRSRRSHQAIGSGVLERRVVRELLNIVQGVPVTIEVLTPDGLKQSMEYLDSLE